MNCIYCKKTFNNKYILKNHQKTAKYCLKIQGIEPESGYKCKFCNKSFSLKQHLVNHNKTCKNLKIENDRLRLMLGNKTKECDAFKDTIKEY